MRRGSSRKKLNSKGVLWAGLGMESLPGYGLAGWFLHEAHTRRMKAERVLKNIEGCLWRLSLEDSDLDDHGGERN